MALTVWTQPSGYDLGTSVNVGETVTIGRLVIGKKYVITSSNGTDFTKLGATSNNPGTVFTATSTGEVPSRELIPEFSYTISILGDTDWNVAAGTSGVVYSPNMSFVAKTKVFGTGTAIQGSGTVSEAWINERRAVKIKLPTLDIPDVKFQIISGNLPPGLRLSDNYIVGTAFEVANFTEFRFVVRASNGREISDRTFLISVEGADLPIWNTNPGALPVGANQTYYIIDSSFVDFQLDATDTDTMAGQELTYFIPSGNGELPPGLILSPSGRISGFIQPLLAVATATDPGFYDTGLYDAVSYDFGYNPANGYDSFVNDLRPRKLNRNYEFTVVVSDGSTAVNRTFKIYVVGDDFFRADTTITQAGNGTYTADATYLHAPIFTTPSYLACAGPTIIKQL